MFRTGPTPQNQKCATGSNHHNMIAEGITISSAYAITIIAGAGAIIALLFRLLITAKDEKTALLIAQKDSLLAERDSVRKSYEEIAAEAIKSARDNANYYREKEGKPPLIMAAPVIPESHSPSTAKQREAAHIQTMRAAVAVIKLAAGQPPRSEPERANEKLPPEG